MTQNQIVCLWPNASLLILNDICASMHSHYVSIDPRIEKTFSVIHGSYKDKIRLSQLASAAHLSESRFRHLFKQETGSSIRQYILNIRTLEAVKLIINGRRVPEIMRIL